MAVLLVVALVGGGAYFLTKDDDDDKAETADQQNEPQDDTDDSLDLPTDDDSDDTLPDEPDDSDDTVPSDDDDVATDPSAADAVLAAFVAAETEADCEAMWSHVTLAYGSLEDFVPTCEDEYASYGTITVDGEPTIVSQDDTTVVYEVPETVGGEAITASYTLIVEDDVWRIDEW